MYYKCSYISKYILPYITIHISDKSESKNMTSFYIYLKIHMFCPPSLHDKIFNAKLFTLFSIYETDKRIRI